MTRWGILAAVVTGYLRAGCCIRADAIASITGSQAGLIHRASADATTNPLVVRYRELARHYTEDALEAERAAAYWAAKAKAAVSGAASQTRQNTRVELQRQGVYTLARSVWKVDRMLADPAPEKAAIAAQKAAAPYNEAFREYQAARVTYEKTAQGYNLRANSDEILAKQLLAYADQYLLQGSKTKAESFKRKSRVLTEQAAEFHHIAAKYAAKARTVEKFLPNIKRMADAASSYAAWKENPEHAVPPEQVYAYTVAPPA
mmetsp:Transcript_148381/g.413394  ORF Transcript_148381/g.413394 Transcript_148381/m.413394 type:complete len:260 (-) Transcript_148381:38-817(-)